MKTQNLEVSEYIYALVAILVLTFVQLGFSCYCCYRVFCRRAARCPCETSSECLCGKIPDPENNTGLEEINDDKVKDVVKTTNISSKTKKQKSTKIKTSKSTKISGDTERRNIKTKNEQRVQKVEKKSTNHSEVSIQIEHTQKKTTTKGKHNEKSLPKTKNIDRSTIIPIVMRETETN